MAFRHNLFKLSSLLAARERRVNLPLRRVYYSYDSPRYARPEQHLARSSQFPVGKCCRLIRIDQSLCSCRVTEPFVSRSEHYSRFPLFLFDKFAQRRAAIHLKRTQTDFPLPTQSGHSQGQHRSGNGFRLEWGEIVNIMGEAEGDSPLYGASVRLDRFDEQQRACAGADYRASRQLAGNYRDRLMQRRDTRPENTTPYSVTLWTVIGLTTGPCRTPACSAWGLVLNCDRMDAASIFVSAE